MHRRASTRLVHLVVFTLVAAVLPVGPALITSAAAEPANREEVERLRTETSKTFVNPDGTLTARLFNAPVHFKDEGSWKEIDSDLEDSEQPGYAWGNKANDFHVDFKDELSDGFVRFAGDGFAFDMTLSGATHVPSDRGPGRPSDEPDPACVSPSPTTSPSSTAGPSPTPTGAIESPAPTTVSPGGARSERVEGCPPEDGSDHGPRRNQIGYQGAFPNVDVEYEVVPEGVKETLLLGNRGVPTTYSFELHQTRGAPLTPEKDPDGSWLFYRDGAPIPAFELSAPEAWDSADHPAIAPADALSLDVARAGDGFVVRLSVDATWLRAPGREFPVYLDPTITTHTSLQDGIYDPACSTCDVSTTGSRLKAGGDGSVTWRSLLQFDLGDLPTGASVSSAKVKLFYDYWCMNVGGTWCGQTGAFDLHRMTNSWNTSTLPSGIQFDPNALSSYSFSGGEQTRWLDWDITSTMQNWMAGTQTNFGLLLKRGTESVSSGGLLPPSADYSLEPGIRPVLEVTYSGDGVHLSDPRIIHSNGAELRWARSSSTAFQKYEVHRSATANFTPSTSTLLATIRDQSLTTFTDTTAAPSKVFYYRVVANSAISNERRVTTPSDGNATMIIQPDATTGRAAYLYNDLDAPNLCNNAGKLHELLIGHKPNGDYQRGLVEFDLKDVPTSATVTDAKLSVWRPYQINHAVTVSAHRVTKAWKEGSGSFTCSNDGATWKSSDGTSDWATPGGDHAATAAASMTRAQWDPADWDSFTLTSLVQDWVDGDAANYGILLRSSLEGGSGTYKEFRYFSDDYTVAPTLRPKLTVSYADGSHAKAPDVTFTSPQASSVSGQSVRVAAVAADDRRVDKVEFLLDDVVKATDTSAPYEYVWDSTTATNGAHTWKAKATDDAGNTTTATFALTVDNSALPNTAVTAPGSPTYKNSILADSPRAYWRLGDATGQTAADTSGNGYPGTYQVVTRPATGALVGDADTGGTFIDASDSEVQVPDAAGLDFGTADFTAEAWIKTGTIDADRAFIGKGASTGPYWEVTVTDDTGRVGHVRTKIVTSTVTRTFYGPAIRVDDGRWHHIAVVQDRDFGAYIYVDGVVASTAGTTGGDVSNAGSLIIGDMSNQGGFNGDIDDVAVYPAALSATRVQAHHDAGRRKVSGVVPITATGSDDAGVTKVEFLIDGVVLSEDATSPYAASWDTNARTVPSHDGLHTITSRATDTSGQTFTSEGVTVDVVNTNGTKYKAGYSSTAVPQSMPYETSGTQLTHGVDVTVTNASSTTWTGSDMQLNYRWIAPDGTTTNGTAVSLGADLPAGQARTLRLNVAPPALADGVSKAQYRLRFDLREISTSSWFEGKGNKPLENEVIVNKVLATALGLERYYHYVGEDLGAGMTQLTNVANGNSVVRWTPWSAPGRGLSTVLDITYNALEDHSESPIGNNFSLGISSLTRFGLPLDVHPNNADSLASPARSSRYIEFTDADGTTHRFDGAQAADGSIYWKEPPGVHLYLREYSTTDQTRKWALTRPDRVTFFYDSDGYPTYVRDGNGNELTFTLETVPPGEDPGGTKKRITKVTDAGGRDFKITYWTKATAEFPQTRGLIRSIEDHSNSKLDFLYYRDGNLRKLIQRAGAATLETPNPQDRVFTFTYTTSSGGCTTEEATRGGCPAIDSGGLDARKAAAATTSPQSSRLYSVIDPRGNETVFEYIKTPGTDRWKLESLSDRNSKVTTFGYNNTTRTTTVTAPLSRVTKFTYDTQGSVTAIVDPLDRTTSVLWSSDRHVTKVTEPNNAYQAFTYNDNGYPTRHEVLTAFGADGSAGTADDVKSVTQLVYENRQVDTNDVTGEWRSGRTIPHISQLETVTDPRNNTWAYAVDDNTGNVTSVDPPEDVAINYTYNPDGTLKTMEQTRTADSQLRKTQFFYTYVEDNQTKIDANGFPRLIRDAKNADTEFSFDSDGLMEWIEDPNNARTTFTYDGFHRLVRQTAPVGDGRVLVSGASYDLNDNLIAAYDPGFSQVGKPVDAVYDAMDRVTSIENQEDEKTTFEYDSAGRSTKVVEPLGLVGSTVNDYETHYDYDALDRVIRAKRFDVTPTGTTTLTSHYCYALQSGNLVSVTAPKAGVSSVTCSTPPNFTTTYTYDAAHRVRTVTDPENHTQQVTYDANGNVETTTNARGDMTTRFYDGLDRVTKLEEPFSTGRKVTTRYVYDSVGDMVKLISPRAHDTNPTAPTDFVTEYVYDELHRLVTTKLPTKTGETRHYVHNSYDPTGKVISTSLPVAGDTPGSVGTQAKTTMTYFDTGWIKTLNDPANPKTFFDYSAAGQQTKRTTVALNGTKPWADDAKEEEALTEEWSYYDDGMLKKHTGDRTTATYTYDANNNMKTLLSDLRSDAAKEFSYEGVASFDTVNRLTEFKSRKLVDKNNSPTDATKWTHTTYAYDLNSNVTSRLDAAKLVSGNLVGRLNTFSYNKDDLVTRHWDRGDNSTPTDSTCTDDRYIEIEYESTHWEKNRTVSRAPANCTAPLPSDPTLTTWKPRQKTARTFYQNGKVNTLVTKAVKPDATETIVESHTVDYIDSGIYMNGHRVRDTFLLKHPSGSTDSCGATTCEERFVYDARDRLVQNFRSWGDQTPTDKRTVYYKLDGVGNVEKESYSAPPNYTGAHVVNEYDSQMQLTRSTRNGVASKYFYDDFGRTRCVTTDAGVAGSCDVDFSAINSNVLSLYEYDGLSRLKNAHSFLGGKRVSTTTYAHDALDRLMAQGEKRYNQSTLNDENQTKGRDTAFTYVGLTDLLAKEVRKDRTGASIATKTYSYDPFGRRVAMDNDSHDATRGGNDGVFTYSYDVHGNVSQLLDDAGNVKASYGYTPYGGEDPKLTTDSEQIKDSTGVTATEDPFNSYRYSGFRLDNASGTIDMGFRRFGPDTSRFLSPDFYGGALSDLGLSMDPITGGNRYSLGGGNPISFVEVDGHYQTDGGACGGSSGCGKNPLTKDESIEIMATSRTNATLNRARREDPQGRTVVEGLFSPFEEGLRSAAYAIDNPRGFLADQFAATPQRMRDAALGPAGPFVAPEVRTIVGAASSGELDWAIGRSITNILSLASVVRASTNAASRGTVSGLTRSAPDAGTGDLALGLTSQGGTPLLQPFANRLGARSYFDYDLPRNVAWTDLRGMIDETVASGGRLHFNLEGIDDPGLVAKGQGSYGSWTEMELAYICANAGVRAATTFHGGAAPC